MKIFLLVSILEIVISSNSFSQKACLERIIEEASKIDTLQLSTGTGFLIDDSGYIITNRHVIERSQYLSVSFYVDGKKIQKEAKLIGWYKATDIALLKADIKGLFQTPLPYGFTKTQMQLGQKLFTLGFPKPGFLGENIKLTDGIVSATTGFQDDKELYQISAPIQPGNSGSPIFDSFGNIRGLVIASFQGGQNVNYAIKAELIDQIIKAEGIKPPSYSTSGGFNSKLKDIQSRICLIENLSKKTYYKEFAYVRESFYSKSNSLSFLSELPCGDFDFDKFLRSEEGIQYYPEKYNQTERNLFEKIKSQTMSNALYYTYWTNFNFIGEDVFGNKWPSLYSLGAYENIIEESESRFAIESNGNINDLGLELYLSFCLDYYYSSYLAMYQTWDLKKIEFIRNYLDELITVLDRNRNRVSRFTTFRAKLLVYKAGAIIVSANKATAEVCELIDQAKLLDPDVKVWFNYNCN